jgi:1-acyl-sn-glycerol-3-phosphate acyltransferase
MTGQHPWMPVSPCGESCLPPTDSVPAVTRTRQLLRLLATATMLMAGMVLAAVLPLLGPAQRQRVLRAWHRAVLRALRIQLEISGGDRFAAPTAGVLVVSNHVSWLDLMVLGAVQPLRMVAKSEIRGWPVVGPLARRTGTIFVDRERLSTLPRTVAAVSRELAGGAAIGVFPEGTTWCGLATGRFRPAVFQAALDSATPVRPVALRYCLAGAGATTVASFVGSTTLWEAVLRVAGVHGVLVKVHLLPPLPTAGLDRRTLATRAEAAVTAVTMPAVTLPALISVLQTDRRTPHRVGQVTPSAVSPSPRPAGARSNHRHHMPGCESAHPLAATGPESASSLPR